MKYGYKAIRRGALAMGLAASVICVISIPAQAQYNDNLGNSYNNMQSATIGTWLNGQSSMWYSRQRLYAMMSRSGRRTVDPQVARGNAVIRRHQATMQFAPRPFPVAYWMKNTKIDTTLPADEDRRRRYAGILAQTAKWSQEMRARGARPNDMGDMLGLAMVLSHEVYTGKRASNVGFCYMAQQFRKSFLTSPDYQGRTNVSKQQFYETQLLSATYSWYLHHTGETDKSRTQAKVFMDAWWTSNTPGVINALARYSSKSSLGSAQVSSQPAPGGTVKASTSPLPSTQTPDPATAPPAFDAAVRATSFQPVAESIIPARFAEQAPDAETKSGYEKICRALLAGSRNQISRAFDTTMGPNNVARGLAYYTLMLYSVATVPEGSQIGSKGRFSKGKAKALEQQFVLALAGNTNFRRLSDREKQEAYETFLLGASISAMAYTSGLTKGDANRQESARAFARENLSRLFGAAPDRMRFTENGLSVD